MAILLPDGLPARRQLASEGVPVIDGNAQRSGRQRPLRVALLNLMPRKAVTETQIARLLGSNPHLVELTLLVPGSYRPRTTDPEHLAAFYRPWPEARGERFDGLIVTGAPVETLDFEAVDYWPELTEVLDWADRSVGGSFFICWGAQAALYHRHGVPKHALAEKAFGVYQQRVRARGAALLRGFGDRFPVPVSRHTEVRAHDLPASGAVQVLAESPDSGLCLLHEAGRRAVYMFNHIEYDADTLPGEYLRDRAAGLPIQVPHNTFPQDDPAQGGKASPHNGWRPYAQLLFRNWLDGLAERAARHAGVTHDMAWMLRWPLGPAAPEAGLAEFRIVARDELDSLPAVLKALAAQGLSPLAAHVDRPDGGGLRIALRLDGFTEGQADGTAQSLLRLPAVRRISYRDGRGHGGTFIHAAEPQGGDRDQAAQLPSPCSAAA